MCSECDWVILKNDANHHIKKKCSCGNATWKWTSLQAKSSSEAILHSIYRCTKCDALRSAEHLLHGSFYT
jgi:phage FluMu protein Com